MTTLASGERRTRLEYQLTRVSIERILSQEDRSPEVVLRELIQQGFARVRISRRKVQIAQILVNRRLQELRMASVQDEFMKKLLGYVKEGLRDDFSTINDQLVDVKKSLGSIDEGFIKMTQKVDHLDTQVLNVRQLGETNSQKLASIESTVNSIKAHLETK